MRFVVYSNMIKLQPSHKESRYPTQLKYVQYATQLLTYHACLVFSVWEAAGVEFTSCYICYILVYFYICIEFVMPFNARHHLCCNFHVVVLTVVDTTPATSSAVSHIISLTQWRVIFLPILKYIPNALPIYIEL